MPSLVALVRRARSAVPVVPLLAILAACGTGSSQSAAPLGIPSCAMVSPSSIHSYLGLSVGPPTSNVSGSRTTCTYSAQAGSGPSSDQVVAEFQTGFVPTQFDPAVSALAQQAGTTPAPAPELSSQAASFSAAGVTTLAVLKGSTLVSITAPAPAAQMVALARFILPSVS